jgi:GAF domain-containing protein
MPREALLVTTFVELADNLVEDFDVIELLTVLADRCVEVLKVSAAGLLLIAAEGDLRVMASSTEVMRTIELFELQSQEGPCVECYQSGESIVNQRLAEVGSRWPLFAPEALEAGFQLVHAIPMRIRGSVLGVLNLFHTQDLLMDDDDIRAAQAFADIATIAIVQQRAAIQSLTHIAQLNHALNSRIVLEQAKGILSERNGIDTAEAFAWMRSYARGNHMKMIDVGNGIVAGTLLTAVRLDRSRPGFDMNRPTPPPET